MYGCQQHLLKASIEINAILEFICSEANKLTNCGIYYCRQILFKTGLFVSKYELDEKLKSNLHFRALRSACAQQNLHRVVESFQSYRALNKLHKSGLLTNKPQLPKYRKKGGLNVVSYPARWVNLVKGMLKFSLGKQVKAWFGIDSFELPMPSNLSIRDIKECRNHQVINADCNGAANILRKVATQLNIDLAKVSRAVLSLPKRYGLASLSKSYREKCGASCLKTDAHIHSESASF